MEWSGEEWSGVECSAVLRQQKTSPTIFSLCLKSFSSAENFSDNLFKMSNGVFHQRKFSDDLFMMYNGVFRRQKMSSLMENVLRG